MPSHINLTVSTQTKPANEPLTQQQQQPHSISSPLSSCPRPPPLSLSVSALLLIKSKLALGVYVISDKVPTYMRES